MRLSVVHAIAQRVQLLGESLQEAADFVVQRDLVEIGGEGGVIAVSPDGDIAWRFNTEGMYRAKASYRDSLKIGLYEASI